MSNGKRKGSAFERKICKELSLWWSKGKRDDIFWRTSGSGARSTVRSKKNKQTFGQGGDVQAADPIGQPLIDVFNIEMKTGYKGSHIGEMIDKLSTSKPQYENFISQAIYSHITEKTLSWMVIIRRQNRNIMVITPTCMFSMLVPTAKKRFCRPYAMIRTRIGSKDVGITVFPFLAFTKIVKPKDIIYIAEQRQ